MRDPFESIFAALRSRDLENQFLGKDEGVVVVDVTIDKYGNVLRADPGAPGTKTTDDKYLFVKAKSACQQAKFDNDATAPLSTTGKIYVTFP